MAARRRTTPHLSMVFCDGDGQIFDHPDLALVGASGDSWRPVPWDETIPLPPGSSIVTMPGRLPVGHDLQGKSFQCVADFEGGPAWAAAAVVPPAYLRTLLPAQERGSRAPSLPLLGYTAVGWAEEGFRVAALRLDRRTTWDPEHFGTADLPAIIEARRAALGGNRIVEQLARCSLEYNCYTAQNFFYARWEAGVPVSPLCNARCVGCISLQPADCCPSPQGRIGFDPSADEVAAVLVEHLAKAREPIASFGQGCEGEPLLRAGLIAEAVARARAATPRGTVNINTNGSRPEVIPELAAAGVGSLRVSLASPDPARYDSYHRPVGYGLAQVAETIDRARQCGLRVSLNLLVFPGVTDTQDEARRLVGFLRQHPADCVQMRNLNLDPDGCLAVMRPSGPGMGIRKFLEMLKVELPGVALASFNGPPEKG